MPRDPDFQPRDQSTWAESDPSNRSDPPDAVRNTGYDFADILPSDEFNSVLYQMGNNLDSLARTVGVYKDRTQFINQTEPGDFGYLYDPAYFTFGDPSIPVASDSVYGGSSSEPPRVDSNGETVVVAYGSDIIAFEANLADSFQVKSGWAGVSVPNVVDSVAVGQDHIAVGYVTGGASKIEIAAIDDGFSTSTTIDVADPAPGAVAMEATGPNFIAWHGDTSALYRFDPSGTLQTVQTSSEVPLGFTPEARECVYSDDYAFFSMNQGEEIYQYEFFSQTWRQVTPAPTLANPTNGNLASDAFTVFGTVDYNGGSIRRYRWQFRGNSPELSEPYNDGVPRDFSVNGNVLVAAGPNGNLQILDAQSSFSSADNPSPISFSNGDIYTSDQYSAVICHADDVWLFEDPANGYTIRKFPTTHRPRYVYHVDFENGETPATSQRVTSIPSV